MKHGNNHSDLVIKRIGPENVADMDKLYQKVYGRYPARNYYVNKLGTAFTGIEYTGLMAYTAGGIPVASLCIIPCFIVDGNKRTLAAQLTDAMTDSAYRKRGLFLMLVEQVFILGTSLGIDVLFGFSSQHTHSLLIKNGWEESGRLDRFRIPVKRSFLWWMASFANRAGKLLKSNQYEDMIYTKKEGCRNSVLSDGFAGIERSREYLSYKSFTNTGIVEKDCSKAWIKKGSDMLIGDMEVSENDFEQMMNNIHVIAQRAGLPGISFHCSRNTSLHRLFSRKYEPIPSFPVVWRGSGLPVGKKTRFTLADIDIF